LSGEQPEFLAVRLGFLDAVPESPELLGAHPAFLAAFLAFSFVLEACQPIPVFR
jgi:hypothetical protein